MITGRIACLVFLLRVRYCEADGSAQERPPLSNLKPGTLFKQVGHTGESAPGPFFKGHHGALPTNAWWMNAVLVRQQGSQEGNIFQMPYTIIADDAGLNLMQPFAEQAPAKQHFDVGYAVHLGAVQLGDARAALGGGTRVLGWDELSFSLGWHGTEGGPIIMKTPLVRGSPYITAEFNNSTPRISAKQALMSRGIKVDGRVVKCDGSDIAASSISLDFEQSDTTWLVFAPLGSLWKCRSQASSFELVASKPLAGAVRIALANPCTSGRRNRHCSEALVGWNSDRYAALLRRHAGCYPGSSKIRYAVHGDVGEVTWNWDRQCLSGWDQGTSLLQLAWPVHLPLLTKAAQREAESNPRTPFRDVRGPAVAVAADRWTFSYTLFPDVGLSSAQPVASHFRDKLLHSLKGSTGARWNGSMPDKDFDLPLNYQLGVGDTYFSGKMLARLARIIAIADEIGESQEEYFGEMIERLRKRLEAWLNPAAPNPLLYEVAWGGMVACGCRYSDCEGQCTPFCANPTSPTEECPAMLDSGFNFGNAWYNDHHFHYGYFVYAAAVLAKYNPRWGQEWREHVLALIRDYANPSLADGNFPLTRQKDWFLGFSYASGIKGAWTLGRNQESASEAINSYYALYTYGHAISQSDSDLGKQLMDFGRILLAMESHSADTYWHVRPNSIIYPRYDYKIVGILWTNQAEHQTWFGTTPYIVGGIELLPIVPASEAYLDPGWVSYHFPDYLAACSQEPDCSASGWSWAVCMEQAVIDADAAQVCIDNLPKHAFNTGLAAANGNSLTNALHWVATRPRFIP
eukprot:TRINITY_DN103275_c0_g1_i1.p1 TRINITY_DN103275_c0_g1~~TRINITY_DN103275_c0_g1_i1.p1  ORF type:complete len:800 (+),score=104.10 TRINITY_DN103275_c0_g1_i1:66-2465(+)